MMSSMKRAVRPRALVAAILALGIVASGSMPAAAAVKLGLLECRVKEGIGLIIMEEQPLSCTFSPDGGRPETYRGDIRKFGLDVGVTAGTVIVWAVFAAQTGYVPGSLAGKYVGISAEASVGFGVGANALLGGSNKSIALQPVSVQGQVGLDIAVGITDIDLVQR